MSAMSNLDLELRRAVLRAKSPARMACTALHTLCRITENMVDGLDEAIEFLHSMLQDPTTAQERQRIKYAMRHLLRASLALGLA